MKIRLFTPGPVEIPPRILRALSAVPPHHRTEVFRDTLRRVLAELRWVHGTEGEMFLLSSSGTGAMEAAVVNLLGPTDKALVATAGKFGDRWASILKAYGVAHEVLSFDWGTATDPAAIERALAKDPSIRAVFATHSETSTGALHDIEAIARITRAAGRMLVVDAITSLAVHPLPQDAWGVDVVVCGSQKGLMIPPGLATVSLAPWAADAIEGERLPRFYFDLRKARKSAPRGETSFTPPISLVLALEEALRMMAEEGLAQVHQRHARVAGAVRAGARALGFGVFPRHPSNAVSALTAPAGVEASAIVKRLRETHGIVVAGGQDQLKGKILRVGHMGHYDRPDADFIVAALGECVANLGGPAPDQVGRAMQSAWEQS
jgi:aspartate aminotransferase-like enzyme